MDEELSLEEFLHPDIFKWMNTDIVLDSEHATTVESDAETMGVPRVVTSNVPEVPQVGAGVKATPSNEIQFRAEHLISRRNEYFKFIRI